MQAMHGTILKVCYEPKMIINPLLHNTGWLEKKIIIMYHEKHIS